MKCNNVTNPYEFWSSMAWSRGAIEYRAESVAEAHFVRDYIHLDRLTFYRGRRAQPESGKVPGDDVAICSGILYHLDAPDVFHFVRRILRCVTPHSSKLMWPSMLKKRSNSTTNDLLAFGFRPRDGQIAASVWVLPAVWRRSNIS